MVVVTTDLYQAAWLIMNGGRLDSLKKLKTGGYFHGRPRETWELTISNTKDEAVKDWQESKAIGNVCVLRETRLELKRYIKSSEQAWQKIGFFTTVNQMNPEAQAELNRLLALDINDLTPTHIAFLKARSSYLSEDDRIRLAELIEDNTQEEISTTQLTFSGLKSLAKQMGLKVPVGITTEKLHALIEEAANQQPNNN